MKRIKKRQSMPPGTLLALYNARKGGNGQEPMAARPQDVSQTRGRKPYVKETQLMNAMINRSREGFTLIELLIVVAIIGILAAIAIPQYAKYRKGAQDNAAQSAYHAVATAEEAYFAEQGRYINSYSSLALKGGLVKDTNVYYGSLATYVNSTSNTAGFTFSVKHKADGSTVYKYDSASNTSTVKTTSAGLTTSTW